MADTTPHVGAFVSVVKGSLQQIFDALRHQGFTLIGPTLGDGAIILDEIEEVAALPIDWSDEHEGGTYRLRRRGDGAYFGYVVGPQSWKQFLYPPNLKLYSVMRQNGSFTIQPVTEDPPRYAFVGVRPCDVQASSVQDRIFLNGPFQEPNYKARRQRAFVLAVNCTEPGNTCFCALP